MAKIGDIVRYLNTVGGGRITRIEGQIAYVDEDGFETPVMLRELVVVAHAGEKPSTTTFTPVKEDPQPQMQHPAPAPKPESEIEEYEETEQGETLNIVLAYAANDLKRISHTSYDAFLVNDSNYYLYYTYLTRGDQQQGWTTRSAGLLEPAMQIFIGEVAPEDLAQMDRVAVQFIPFKKDKEFNLKAVACVEHKLDTTKFFKLHCFQPNPYFDEPVIALPIVKNDLPVKALQVNAAALESAMREKKRADAPQPKPQKPKPRKDEPLVVDLHIAELVDTTAGLSNADMLNLQIDKFREVMDANLRNHGRKIIFIHGKGEGVLRAAITKELNHRYKGHDVQDALFREYGYGATQVTIK